MAMANMFPHVEVIGMDLAPGIMNEENVPDNCRFELDDVNRGLPHFYGQIDLVHMRQVSAGVSHRRLCPSPKDLSRQVFNIILLHPPKYNLNRNIRYPPQITNYHETVGELVKCLKPGGMLILIDGDPEWTQENQTDRAVPADPNCPDSNQPGKSWIAQNVFRKYPSSHR